MPRVAQAGGTVTPGDALVELQSWADTSGRHPSPEARELWARTLLPHDDLAWAQRYLESKNGAIPTSTCALVYLRFLSLLGCGCREHATPYKHRPGQAVADVERLARRHGAWRTSDLSVYPSPGDALCMRPDNPHVSVVTGSRASDGAILSIDGGQEDNTWTRERERTLLASGHVVDLDDGVSTHVGRVSPLYARVDTGEILATLARCS